LLDGGRPRGQGKGLLAGDGGDAGVSGEGRKIIDPSASACWFMPKSRRRVRIRPPRRPFHGRLQRHAAVDDGRAKVPAATKPKELRSNDRRVNLAGRLPVRRSTCSRPELTIAGARDLPPPSDRRRLSPKLLCLNLLRELHALLRTELFCPRFLAPLIGRAECLRRFLILCSILLQSTITGHPDLLLQQPQFGLPCVGTT